MSVEVEKRRILIIDNEPMMQRLFESVLGRGWSTWGGSGVHHEASAPTLHYSSTGPQGLELVQRALQQDERYALVFVDHEFPSGSNGVDTASRLWEVDSDLELVIYTHNTRKLWDEVSTKLKRSSQLLILEKPFARLEIRQLSYALTEKWYLRHAMKQSIDELKTGIQDTTRDLETTSLQLEAEKAERERVQLELLQAQKLQAVGQLAAGIAHEINTPMQYVGDNTRFLKIAFSRLTGLLEKHRQLLQGAGRDGVERAIAEADALIESARLDFLNAQIPRAIDQSLEGLDRVTHIIQAMKEFSHPGFGSKSRIDINESIRNVVTVARTEWKYVAEVSLDLDDALPLVPCLPGEINQVMLNLIVNAAHAIGEREGKGLITVATRQNQNWVEVRVSDTGTGIRPEIRDQIFNPFFTTKEVGKGTGQGLAIARSVVVDKHGGRLFFEPRAGGGTSFFVHLPLFEVES